MCALNSVHVKFTISTLALVLKETVTLTVKHTVRTSVSSPNFSPTSFLSVTSSLFTLNHVPADDEFPPTPSLPRNRSSETLCPRLFALSTSLSGNAAGIEGAKTTRANTLMKSLFVHSMSGAMASTMSLLQAGGAAGGALVGELDLLVPADEDLKDEVGREYGPV